jgi:uncharacterized protein
MRQGETRAHKPRWRELVDFPLVALAIAVALFVAAAHVAALGQSLLPPVAEPSGLIGRAALVIVLALLTYKVAIARLGERPRDELKLRDLPKGLAAGLLLGFGLFCAVVGVAAAADVYNIVGRGGTQQLLHLLIAATILPAFMEELLFRGILFRWIEEFAGSWAALVVTSALFGLAHITNPNASWFSSFTIAVEAGLLLGGAYMLTRSLWMPIGLHAAWNFTQGFVFDVPVSGIDQEGLVEARLSGPELLSGGAFGLEASLIALVIATTAGVWLVAMAVRRGELVRPWWVRRRLANWAEAMSARGE